MFDLATAREGFVPKDALRQAQWSKAAYYDSLLPDGFSFSTNCEWVKHLTIDVSCLVIHEADRVTFAFEGTHDFAGWMADAHIAFHDYKTPSGAAIGIHNGFYGTVDAIFDRLTGIAKLAMAQGKKVFVTGHSKGAGECVIFAARLFWESAIKVETILNFGMPRVFNRAAQIAFEAIGITVWRVVDQEDIICRVPSLMGYHHVGQVAFFNAEGDLSENPALYFRVVSDFFGMVWGLFKRKDVLIDDHAITEYIEVITAWISKYEGTL